MSETQSSDAISEMTQDQLRDRIAYEYVIKKAPTKVQYQELYGDIPLDILLQNIRSTIDSVMKKYGDPYINVEGTSGRASYSGAGKVLGEVPEYFHHQGDERPYINQIVRDSLSQERLQQKIKYGDMGDHVERGGGESFGHYGVSHQEDKGLYIDQFTTFGDYVSENPLAFLFNPVAGLKEFFAGKTAKKIPTVESEAHSTNEWKLEGEMDQLNRMLIDNLKSEGELNLYDR